MAWRSSSLAPAAASHGLRCPDHWILRLLHDLLVVQFRRGHSSPAKWRCGSWCELCTDGDRHRCRHCVDCFATRAAVDHARVGADGDADSRRREEGGGSFHCRCSLQVRSGIALDNLIVVANDLKHTVPEMAETA